MSRNLAAPLLLCLALVACGRPTPQAPAAATPPTTPVLPPVSPAPTASATAAATAAPTPSPLPSETPLPTATPAIVKGPAWVPPGVDAPIAIHMLAYEYARSGRPPGMDDPTLGCAPFDESRPVIMLTATLRIYNRSQETMRDWYAYFVTPGGEKLYTCHRDLEQMPALPPGYYVDVTFGAFMEGGQVRVRGYVFDRKLGRSNEVEF